MLARLLIDPMTRAGADEIPDEQREHDTHGASLCLLRILIHVLAVNRE
jgi:hypothetical protein